MALTTIECKDIELKYGVYGLKAQKLKFVLNNYLSLIDLYNKKNKAK